MKKIFFLFLLFLSLNAVAQDYKTGIGLRGGLSNGLTVKHFISKNAAIEGILTSRWRGFAITGLYEMHYQAFNVKRLNWYFGGGAHIGTWRGYDGHPWFKDDVSYTVFGLDGILGIEYNIAEIPINIGVDWKPVFNLTGYNGFLGDELALSVRYIF